MQRPKVPRPLIFGHRGAPQVAPENTLPAFQAALQLGADGVELDVQYSSDGKLVVIHNPTLDATTNGQGRVTSHTLDELRSLDAGGWFGAQFSGTRIPTLEEVLELAKGKLLVNIELKALDAATSGMGVDVVAAVRGHGMVDQVVLSSFNPFVLRRAKQAGPEVEAALLLAPDLPSWTRWSITRRFSRAEGINPEFPMVNDAYMARAHQSGLRVSVWTVNDEERMRQLIDLGVDAIITDVPDRLAALLKSTRTLES